MPALKNIRREKFCQGIVSGLSQTEAYICAGYSERGAKQSAARLLANPDVRSRVSELRQEIESSFVRLQITERLQRLVAIQDRWDSLREAKACFAKEDYKSAMRTGVVIRELKSLKREDGKGYKIIEEYKINTPLIESLNSVERRAAIETGQEVDRQDINRRGKVNDEAEVLKKAFTFAELEAMRQRMRAVIDAEQGKSASPANIIELKPIPEDDSKRPAASPQSASDQGSAEGKRPSWRD